jgi:hypothetical protein
MVDLARRNAGCVEIGTGTRDERAAASGANGRNRLRMPRERDYRVALPANLVSRLVHFMVHGKRLHSRAS